MSARPDGVLPPRDPAVKLLVIVGCAHALLFLASYALLATTPGARAPDEELVAFYQSGSQRRLVLVGLYVMPFAGITFLWFSMTLRAWIRAGAAHAGEFASGLHLASSILYVALFFAGAAASAVMAVSVEFTRSAVDPMVARQFPMFGSILLVGFAMRMAGMFVITSSRLGRLAGVLPRWFAHVGLVVSLVLLLSASLSRILVLIFPLWLLALCAVLPAHAWKKQRAR